MLDSIFSTRATPLGEAEGGDTASAARRHADRVLAELDADFFTDIGDIWED